MKKTRWFNAFTTLFLVGTLLAMSGCKQEDIVYQKSLADLNAKAQQMLQSGDVDGAISRLESAHDLEPNEPTTTFNLAIAYQMKGDYDKSIALFTQLLKTPGQDQAEIHKNLAITYETKADSLDSKVHDLTTDPKKAKSEQSQIATLKQQSLESYQLALQHYQSAEQGAKDLTEIQQHIQALQAKLQHPQEKSNAGSTQ